jgi:hypothetical protein
MRADLQELFTVARERIAAVTTAVDAIEAAVVDLPAPAGTPMQEWRKANPLRRWRLRRRPRLSQHQAAALLDVAPITVSNWERGDHRPNDASFEAITQHTGITYAEWDRWLDAKPEN